MRFPPVIRFQITAVDERGAYPSTMDGTVIVSTETEDVWRIRIEDVHGNRIFDRALDNDAADEVRRVSAVSLRSVVTGLSAVPQWSFTNDVHTVVLGAGHLEEIAAWLEYWQGEAEWPAGQEWEW